MHGNRGLIPPNQTSATSGDLRGRLVEFAQGPLAGGWNPIRMPECLAEAGEPIELSARTVRRIVAAAGLRLPAVRLLA